MAVTGVSTTRGDDGDDKVVLAQTSNVRSVPCTKARHCEAEAAAAAAVVVIPGHCHL
mgnify:CR=1 FL=1